MKILVATQSEVLSADSAGGGMQASKGLDGQRPTCLAGDARGSGRVWCGTDRGIFRSDDAGASWVASGLQGRRITAIAPGTGEDLVWAGTEPSAVWRSADGGRSWEQTPDLERLPSSSEWSFPPRPDTHHVRWIACHPAEPGRLWVAIEAGALISTLDGGKSWRDRMSGGPWDTHELAIHPRAPEVLRVAAGDGYFESSDGGESWRRPREGMEVTYLVSVAMDPGRPEVVVVSGASSPRTAYRPGLSDGRLYRRVGDARWERIVNGWPDPPSTIAPLVVAGNGAGEIWAADERGVHRSDDGGASWRPASGFPVTPNRLSGICLSG